MKPASFVRRASFDGARGGEQTIYASINRRRAGLADCTGSLSIQRQTPVEIFGIYQK